MERADWMEPELMAIGDINGDALDTIKVKGFDRLPKVVREQVTAKAIAQFEAANPRLIAGLMALGARRERERIKGIHDALAAFTPGDLRFYADVINPMVVDGRSSASDVLCALNKQQSDVRARQGWVGPFLA